MLNEISLGERRHVVELGSGMSTVVIARLLAERGGRLTSLEHDPTWAAHVRRQLEAEELGAVTELVETPLEPLSKCQTNGEVAIDKEGAPPWYRKRALERLPGEVDLLLVDGPPGYGEGMEHSRYPALPLLADRLAESAVVFLDDATRPGEQAILAHWAEERPDWTFGVDPGAGIAIGRRTA